MPQRTSVVILNWNTRYFLEKFLPGVVEHSSNIADIIVVDNASTDDSVSYVTKNFPAVRIIRNQANEGYTGGYNSSLSQINSEYFILLNSDVKVTPGWINPLLSVMDENRNAGACQPKILSHDSPGDFEYAGAAGGFIDKFGYPFCRGRIFQSVEQDNNQYNDNQLVFWASGACMMIRSSAYFNAGGFDENFFAHMEEIDLCWRLQKSGYTIHYCSSSIIYHVGGGTLHKSNPGKTYLNFRNNLLMIYKNHDAQDLSKVLRIRYFLDLLASLKFLFSGGWNDFKAVWKARRDFNKLKTRYSRPFSANTAPKNDHVNLIYPKSILWDYYLCGRKTFSSLGWLRGASVRKK